MPVYILYLCSITAASVHTSLTKLFNRQSDEAAVFNVLRAFTAFLMFFLISLPGAAFHIPTIAFGMGYGVFLSIAMYMGYLALCGYKLQPNLCVTCQQRLDGKAYLDLSQGGFVCQNCQTPNAVVVSRPAKALFDLLDGLPVEKLKNVNATGNQVKECLQVLSTYLSYSFAKIKSLSELAKM